MNVIGKVWRFEIRMWNGIKTITGVAALNRRLYRRGFRDISDRACAALIFAAAMIVLALWP